MLRVICFLLKSPKVSGPGSNLTGNTVDLAAQPWNKSGGLRFRLSGVTRAQAPVVSGHGGEAHEQTDRCGYTYSCGADEESQKDNPEIPAGSLRRVETQKASGNDADDDFDPEYR